MGAILLSPLYILLNYYLIRRMLLWFRTLQSFLGSPWFVIPFLTLYIMIALSPLAAAFGRKWFRTVSRKVYNCWMGILTYLLLFLLLADLGRLLLRLAQHRSVLAPLDEDFYRITGGILFGSVIAVSLYGVVHAAHLKKKSYDAVIHKECSLSSMKIALVADLHLGGTVGLPQARQISRIIREMHPDLIVFAGDIFDNDFDAIRNPREIAALFRDLDSTYGSYACWGNHDISEVILAGFTFSHGDRKVSSDPRMDQFLEEAGIRLLADETMLVDDAFYPCGRLDASCRDKSGVDRSTARELLSSLDHRKPMIVMDHQPGELAELAQAGADLVLSGHTHDGQLFPGNLFLRLAWKNSCGKLVLGNMTSIVTSGAGVWGPAMRTGTDSEVVEVRVRFSGP